jgi:5-formyltetrahydrofolate cyclo-ligase
MTAYSSEHLSEMKKRLRRNMRALRGALDSDTRSTFDHSIRHQLQQLVEDRGCRSIAAYWPFNGEPDITPLFEPWKTAGCELALPVVSGQDDHAMQFHAWQPGAELTANRYGIFEPLGAPVVELADCDLLLMPLVAYDADGNRLGMGKGYYDRHLSPLRNEPSPLRAGIAYSLQQAGALHANPWDVPLHGLVNERGWFTFTELH